MLLAYQNCGTDSGLGNSIFAKSNEFPSPYDLKVNQVAYMSCSEQKDVPNEDGVFFTFRAGAYGEGAGLRLSDSFLYEARREDEFDKMEILATDAPTVMTRVQLAMRQPALLSRMFVNADSNGGLEEQDYDFVFGDIGSEEMSASLIKLAPGQYMNYWSAGGINEDAYFSATLLFNGSETLANTVRSSLESKAWALVFGFTDPVDPTAIRTLEDFTLNDDTSAEGGNSSGGSSGDTSTASTESVAGGSPYGVGLRVSFKKPLASIWGLGEAHPNMPQRVLESIQDFNLENPGSTNASWSCPTSLQFRIIHPDDVFNSDGTTKNASLCAVVHDPAVPSDLLKIVRRSLPAQDWYVNLAQQCVIPRKHVAGSCYGVDQGTQVRRTPVYGFNNACNPALNAGGTGVCSHFVSICDRP